MSTSKKGVKPRIAEIRKRVQEYHKHKNDPYAYAPEEIDAVRMLKAHALADIEFLLSQVDKSSNLHHWKTIGDSDHIHGPKVWECQECSQTEVSKRIPAKSGCKK